MKSRDDIRPLDWPEKNGEIDLDIHDLPHASSATEWWYINGHFTGDNDQEYSLFASFFRKLIEVDEATGIPEYAHSITWAIIDVQNRSEERRVGNECRYRSWPHDDWKTDDG